MSIAVDRPLPDRPRRAPFQWSHVGVHGVLILYTCIALAPVLLIISNSLKSANDIFAHPFMPPTTKSFDAVGYKTVANVGHFDIYFKNSIIVTVVTVFLVMTLSAMAAYALSEYRFMGNTVLGIFFAIGIMIPIRLGTVSILRLTKDLGLLSGDSGIGWIFGPTYGPLAALVFVYTAMGIPLGIFLMSQFMKQVPSDLKNAARVDGAGEYRVFSLTLPLVRPGLAAVAVFTMLPVWNDLWFPLLLAPNEATRTVTLGAQQFLGQYASDWNSALAALTLAMLPVMALYIIFSRQFLGGLTKGAID
jgi:raffinose/stachyose/melibiose transport system permease protein